MAKKIIIIIIVVAAVSLLFLVYYNEKNKKINPQPQTNNVQTNPKIPQGQNVIPAPVANNAPQTNPEAMSSEKETLNLNMMAAQNQENKLSEPIETKPAAPVTPKPKQISTSTVSTVSQKPTVPSQKTAATSTSKNQTNNMPNPTNKNEITINWYSMPKEITINFLAKMVLKSALAPYLKGNDQINIDDYLDNTVIYDAGKVQGGDYNGREIYKLDYTDPSTQKHTKVVAIEAGNNKYVVLEKNSDKLDMSIPANDYVSFNKDLVIKNMQ